MLTIRFEQMARMNLAKADFEERMLRHIQRFFAARWKVCGADGMRTLVQLGVTKAIGYRFSRPPAIGDYLSSMLYLGSGFDEDPKFPWAAAVLASGGEETARARELKLTVLAFISDAEGMENEHLDAALARLREMPMDELLPPRTTKNRTDYFVDRLRFVHPAKCEVIGVDALARFVEQAVERAAVHGFQEDGDVATFVALAFMLGSSFDHDPQFPPLVKALSTDTEDVAIRAARLFRAGRAYLQWSRV